MSDFENRLRNNQGADNEPEEIQPKPFLKTVCILVGLFIVCLLSVYNADGHEAPTGWKYPISCCSGLDCREVKASAISERQDGYLTPSGEVIGYRDARVKESPDGAWHWCTQAGSDTGRTICLFAPPRSY